MGAVLRRLADLDGLAALEAFIRAWYVVGHRIVYLYPGCLMSVVEGLKRSGRAVGGFSQAPTSADQKLREAAGYLLEVVVDAVGGLIVPDRPEDALDQRWDDHTWVKATRLRARRSLFAMVARAPYGVVARSAFRRAISGTGQRCDRLGPWDAVLHLLRDRRGDLSSAMSANEVEEHIEACEAGSERCAGLRQGLSLLNEAFAAWLTDGKRFPGTQEVLRSIARTGFGVGDMLLQLRDGYPWDYMVDLVLEDEPLEAQAYKLIGWTRDDGHWGSGAPRRAESELDEGRLSDAGPMGSPSVELLDDVEEAADAILRALGRETCPEDRDLVLLAWSMRTATYTLPGVVEPEQLSVSDQFRVLAASMDLVEGMAVYYEAAGRPGGNWKRRALRMLIGLHLRGELRRGVDPSIRDGLLGWFHAFQVANPAGFAPRIVRYIEAPDVLSDLERDARRIPDLGRTAKRVRDIYDEVMGRIDEALRAELGVDLDAPETLISQMQPGSVFDLSARMRATA